MTQDEADEAAARNALQANSEMGDEAAARAAMGSTAGPAPTPIAPAPPEPSWGQVGLQGVERGLTGLANVPNTLGHAAWVVGAPLYKKVMGAGPPIEDPYDEMSRIVDGVGDRALRAVGAPYQEPQGTGKRMLQSAISNVIGSVPAVALGMPPATAIAGGLGGGALEGALAPDASPTQRFVANVVGSMVGSGVAGGVKAIGERAALGRNIAAATEQAQAEQTARAAATAKAGASLSAATDTATQAQNELELATKAYTGAPGETPPQTVKRLHVRDEQRMNKAWSSLTPEEMAQSTVPTAPMKAAAGAAAYPEGVRPEFAEALTQLPKQAQLLASPALEQNMTVAEARLLRKSLVSSRDQAYDAKNWPLYTSSRDLVYSVDDALGQASARGDDVAQKLLEANAATRQYHSLWGSGTVGEKLLSKQPADGVVGQLLKSDPDEAARFLAGVDPQGRVAIGSSFVDKPLGVEGLDKTNAGKALGWYRNNESLGRAVLGDTAYDRLTTKTQALVDARKAQATAKAGVSAAEAAAKAPPTVPIPAGAGLPRLSDLQTLGRLGIPGAVGAGALAQHLLGHWGSTAALAAPALEWAYRAGLPGGLLRGAPQGALGALFRSTQPLAEAP